LASQEELYFIGLVVCLFGWLVGYAYTMHHFFL